MMFVALVALFTLSAQAQRPNQEEMKERRAQMIAQQAEKLAKECDLKDEAKTQFVATYKAYQDELQSTQRNRQWQRNGQQTAEKKKLSDEEAQKQVQDYFTRQEENIAQLQKRLEVEKKYLAEFQKTLTPQQLAKIFRQRQQNMGGMQNGQRQYGPRQGGFGGPQGNSERGGFGGPGGDF